MNKQDESAAAVFIVFLWLVPGILLGGWTLMLLWGWFITPLGVASIGLFHAVGLSLIIAFFKTDKPIQNGDSPIEAAVEGIFTHIFKVLIVLGLGWIVLQLMGG